MKLEDIGFYTLSDKRAKNVSWQSDLQRCELILTDRCNFKCAYCRGIKKELQGDLSSKQAKEIVNIWTSANLHNIRFSGGEPTLWKDLLKLVEYTKSKKSLEHIALSTNGSANLNYYLDLWKAGVNDFSISLDACCSSTADLMAGTKAKFDHLSNVISKLSKLTYVTVGVVLDNRNIKELKEIVNFAKMLGVSDIRIIPSAQYNQKLKINMNSKYPIFNYRINNTQNNIHVRGLSETDCRKCHLVKDDMIVLHGYHFPCVIYMREQGKAIGTVYGKTTEQIRQERKEWFEKHDSFEDKICRIQCLDVCREHNNKVEEYSNA
jgi:sulfatase maturation enzyme AslB (radical SAM superfamily)